MFLVFFKLGTIAEMYLSSRKERLGRLHFWIQQQQQNHFVLIEFPNN